MYLIGIIFIIPLTAIIKYFSKRKLLFSYTIGFLLSIVVMAISIAWLSGNSLQESFRRFVFNRIAYVGMIDPYILSNLIVIVLLYKEGNSRTENVKE
jgi:hypothetical protein